MQNFYEDVPEDDIATFRKNKMDIRNFKAEFPKLFLNKKINQETMKKRVEHQDNSKELELILNKISELL